jgi:hypothetical protein
VQRVTGSGELHRLLNGARSQAFKGLSPGPDAAIQPLSFFFKSALSWAGFALPPVAFMT